MKVFNLRCSQDHQFEGWFASEADRQDQLARGLLTCPLCGDPQVALLPSAPRLQVGPRATEPAACAPGGQTPATDTSAATLQAAWMKAVRHIITHTDDVGERFAEEARRIHYGEAEARGIRGQASTDEAQALREEGIEVVSLPWPTGPLQ